MLNTPPEPKQEGQSAAGDWQPLLPSPSLPIGGGAIRGMGEKFAAHPVTGTGSMSVPIPTSPGRGGFGPQLSLTYDSAAGNGPFGLGWSLVLPSITRKTDRGLPQYDDANESDVFVLSGMEDLVPVLNPDGSRFEDVTTVPGFAIRRYRPRVEGLFARIERWTRAADGDVHWRSISGDNVLTLYGPDARSRIADPEDGRRIFRWLICETRDDRGNAVLYDYKPEDGLGVDLSQARERNRGDLADARRTANRYLKGIRYGNRNPLLNGAGQRPHFLADLPAAQVQNAAWMFQVILDYGEHDAHRPAPGDAAPWTYRDDPFSVYRSGFEVRTTRLCRRVLMFHHIPDLPTGQKGYDGLVRSTDLAYSPHQDPTSAQGPVYTFLRSATQVGYRPEAGGYLKRSLPPLEFEYTQPVVQDTVEDVEPASLENLPMGLDGATYLWVDLHGEGIPGLLTEQAGAWYYKRNLSPLQVEPGVAAHSKAAFALVELVANKSNHPLAMGLGQLLDLAGDGKPDLVALDGPVPGFWEHDAEEGWEAFRPFASRLNRDVRDPNLRFVDLDGDGHADVLITEEDAFVWHPSLAEEGFGPARRAAQARDVELGPRLVFADPTQSIYLADMSGDGLTDLVRIRSGEVCYWPNLGYGRFGARVTMDHAPAFDHPDQFEQKRIRLADVDGTGTADLLYLHRDGVRLFFNQSGNSWSSARRLNVFPRVDGLASIVPLDLLGNGTACLVWSSSLPGDARRPMRYVNLMGAHKPHLLVKASNNLGAETVVRYAPSTRFYLKDRQDGTPWITRLPFPVHVVERVETHDAVSRSRFITRYAYHHGYFDGEEREFRGFGMVEQWDTEEMAALTSDGTLTPASNENPASHVPPVLTRTWFHTGVYLGRDRVSDYFAGLLQDRKPGEYYREPGLTEAQARALLLPDSLLPPGLTVQEEREACRALKGRMLRQEVYARDALPGAGPAAIQRSRTPYTVIEQNFAVRLEQRRGGNRNAVFFAHPREAITYQYERNPADPRIQHALTLEVDSFGSVLKSAVIGYPRSQPDLSLPLPVDRDVQASTRVAYTENRVTRPVDEALLFPGAYRVPMPAETRAYELTAYTPTGLAGRFQASDLVEPDPGAPGRLRHRFLQEFAYEETAAGARARRVIAWSRILYRKDDLTALLPLGELEPLALPGESYQLAFTPGLLAQVFRRGGQPLLPSPSAVLGSGAADRGGYLSGQQLKADGRFPATDPDDHWWVPSGRVLLSPNSADTAAQERAHARGHFFLPHRSRDPFHTSTVPTESFVTFDAYDLLVVDTRDALGNRVTVGERLANGNVDPLRPGNDYRVLQPRLVTDPDRNRIEVAFDALGLVVGTAVMGKPAPAPVQGDSLQGFQADLTQAQRDAFFNAPDPHAPAPGLLQAATTRVIYDLDCFRNSRLAHPGDPAQWLPVYAATLTRETHAADPVPAGGLRIQIGFSYSDGYGREIQKKIQAEPGPLEDGGPAVSPRWVGGGWTVFNNKGMPVRQYEPFFSTRQRSDGTLFSDHRFEYGVQVGVSPVVFYDPLGRVVATLHPDHTYEKVVFGPWRQVTWDASDTVLDDPRTDPDIRGYTAGYVGGLPTSPPAPPWQTWLARRQGGPPGPQQAAATRAVAHAGTPTTVHFDTLGRPFLTLVDNGPDPAQPGRHLLFATRVELDIEGNQRSVRDALQQAGDPRGRVVIRYSYSMLGGRIHQLSMDAGARWTLSDVSGNPIRAWDERGHEFRNEYDPLRRPVRALVTGADPADPGRELLVNRLVYGEQHPAAEPLNLRGKLFLHLDQVGAATAEAHDFKGNALRTSRRLTSGTRYRHAVDWSPVDADPVALPADPKALLALGALATALAPLLEADTYTSDTTYDALNRPVTVTTPHTPAMQPSVIRPAYNEANLLERVDVNLRGAVAGGQPVWTAFVHGIEYDAAGRRRRVDRMARDGKLISTSYTYDPEMFRLIHLYTRRGVDPATRQGSAFPEDCENPAPPPSTIPAPEFPPKGKPCGLQNLHYTYDPVGNIVHVRDDAQQTVYFLNGKVEPSSDYTYDALYRLIEATGREHLGQTGGTPNSPTAPDAFNAFHMRHDHPNVSDAMGTYTERYVYDAVGNFVEMRHRGTSPVHPGWTRGYVHGEASVLEPGKTSNRLSSSDVGPPTTPVGRFVYDAHGNMVRMPHLGGLHPAPNAAWDFRDQLQMVDLGGGGTAFYVYDAAGQRVRKVWEKSANRIEERLYLGGFEIFRRRDGAGATTLERETLHVMDDQARIALVETRTRDTSSTDPAPPQLIRLQFGNHLGSASLELDDAAQIISYEEYTPYGSTAYQSVRSKAETPKRYRYTGKERDEESGLYYHGARYYAPWLGRWTSCDPSLLSGGINLYRYGAANPVFFVDLNGQTPTSAQMHDASDADKAAIAAYALALDAEQRAPPKPAPPPVDPGCRPIPGVKKADTSKPSPVAKPLPVAGPDSVTVEMGGVVFTMTEDQYDLVTAPAFKQQARDTFNGLGGALGAIGAAKSRNAQLNDQWKGTVRPDTVTSSAGSAKKGPAPPANAAGKDGAGKGTAGKDAASNQGTAQVTLDSGGPPLGSGPPSGAGQPPGGGLPRDVPGFTAAFYASQGQFLNQLSLEVVAIARELGARNPGLTVGVSAGVINGQVEYRVTVSDMHTYNVLNANQARLPQGMQMGPAPTIAANGNLDPMRHVEVEGPLGLLAEGAPSVLVGTSRPACQANCEPQWNQTGSPPHVWHTNRQP